MVFSFPQIPSGLFPFSIDTSPRVIYPAPKLTPKARNRSKSSASQLTPTDHASARPSFGLQHRQSRQSMDSPSSCTDGQGAETLAASVSILDLSQAWEPLPGGGMYERRMSENGLPTRPGHRRSQSAVPLPRRPLLTPTSLSTSPSEPGPQNRLREYSRNSLSSTSAASLPTLLEMEMDMEHATEDVGVSISGPVTSGGCKVSMPPSPIVRPHSRLSRNASLISAPGLSVPTSPCPSPGPSTRCATKARSLVPPPQPAPPPQGPTLHSSMPPPPLLPCPESITYSPSRDYIRHVPSRTHSYRESTSSTLCRPTSRRRTSVDTIGSVEISDVGVVATWSFPASPSPEKTKFVASTGIVSEGDMGERGRQNKQSDRLRERLKSLSGLNTNVRSADSDSTPVSSGAKSSSTAYSGDTIIRPSRPLPSYLTTRHHHSYSSPNLLLPSSGAGSSRSMGSHSDSMPPPPRTQRRATNTRLRNPNPLSMPHGPPSSNSLSSVHRSASLNGKGELSSSPGSMVSDTTTWPSPTSSVQSLPAGSTFSVHLTGECGDPETGSRWWAIPSLSGRSKSQACEMKRDEAFGSKSATDREDMEAKEFGLDVDDNEEEYIDMDHM